MPGKLQSQKLFLTVPTDSKDRENTGVNSHDILIQHLSSCSLGHHCSHINSKFSDYVSLKPNIIFIHMHITHPQDHGWSQNFKL